MIDKNRKKAFFTIIWHGTLAKISFVVSIKNDDVKTGPPVISFLQNNLDFDGERHAHVLIALIWCAFKAAYEDKLRDISFSLF